jgi:hypothetical protein
MTRTGGETKLTAFLFCEKPFQVDATDGSCRSLKAAAHLRLVSYLLDQFGRYVESFGLAAHQYRDLVLGMKVLSIGAMTVGPSTWALALDK